MAGFARSILAAHEQAVAYFTGSGLSGRLRFGVTDDLALTPVPRILRDFRQLYPRIDLELTVSQSGALQRRVESGHLDVAFVKQAAGEGRGQLVRRDRLIWAAAPGTNLDSGRRVALVLYQGPSISRSPGLQALERAGLGVAIFARSLVPDDLIELPASAGLPDAGAIDLVLLTSPRSATEPAEALTAAILASGHPVKIRQD